MLRNRLKLISLAVMAGLVFSIIVASSVLASGAKNNQFTSVFDMKDNGFFTPDIGSNGTTDDLGNGSFTLNPNALNNLKFSVTVDVNSLAPDTEYGISVSIREIVGFPGDGPDGDVEVGKATTDASGNLKFTGTAVLPNPVVVSPGGIANGWRIDQRITAATGTDINTCINCVLVCFPTTKVKLNDHGNGLIPF